MKTINELAESLGVTRQTLYNVIKAEQLSIDELTTERRGKTRLFDDNAEEIIKRALSKRSKNNVNVKDELDNLTRELAEVRKQKGELAEELDKLRAEVEKLKEDNRILIRTNAAQAVTIQQQQEREQMKLATGADQRAEGWIRRTIRRITGKGTERKE